VRDTHTHTASKSSALALEAASCKLQHEVPQTRSNNNNNNNNKLQLQLHFGFSLWSETCVECKCRRVIDCHLPHATWNMPQKCTLYSQSADLFGIWR